MTAATGANAILVTALAYARAGRRIVPFGRDKRPYFKGWIDKATTDPLQIANWWRQHPDANIVTFAGAEAGFFVLDVDPRNGGNESLAKLEREHGVLPATLTCATGGGGRHYYFKTPSFPVRSIVLAPGLDVLGEKKAVVVPPSVHASGVAYAWHGAVRDLAVSPPWLLDRVRPIERPAHVAAPPVVADGCAYARRALEGELEAVRHASDGERNVTLNTSAFSLGQLVGAGLLSAAQVVAALLDAAIDCGLEEQEAMPTIRSGLRAGIAKPRDLRRIGARS